jgi:membrane protein YfhO
MAERDAEPSGDDPQRGRGSWRSPSKRWLHLAAVVWTFVLAGIMLAPALSRGWMIGTYDLLAHEGLMSRPGVVVHGDYYNTDLISEIIQWTTLNWQQVHHGFLPLWNPYNGVGLPLVFNWQSGSFGLPSLIGYLFPVSLAFTAGVVATLVIAGTGAYVFARVLRIGFLGSIMVATVFELGGPLVGWLGYPNAQVLAWGGWFFAASVLVVRGHRRVPAIVLLAVVVAAAVYCGQPETLIIMVGATAVFLVVLLALRALPSRMGFEPGPILRPIVDLVIGFVAALGLAAPLLLPALQLTAKSVRASGTGPSSMSLHALTYLIFPGYDGIPVPGNFGFSYAFFYEQFGAYVGAIAVVLAIVALAAGIRRRRPEVLAVAAVAIVTGSSVFIKPFNHVIYSLPLLNRVTATRALIPLGFALAILAGIGLDEVIKSPRSRLVRVSLLSGFGAATLLLAGLWLVGRGGGYGKLPASVYLFARHVRAESFVWPVICVAVGLVCAALLWFKFGPRLLVPLILLVCETWFLVAAGSIQIASSSDGVQATPAVSALQHVVGSAIVGTGPNALCALGIPPEVNIAYQVHEVNLYDPIVPEAYFTTWSKDAKTFAGLPPLNTFCPSIETAAQARLFGVSYVLVGSRQPGPSGGVFVTRLKVEGRPESGQANPPQDEDLYRIPGSAQATVTAIRPGGPLPPPDAPGTPVAIHDPNPARWSLTTDASTPTVLRLHLTNVPGWHASIDGRPLQLENLSGIMFQARIPPGRHVIELHYWPTSFTAGIVIGVVTVFALLGALGTQLPAWRRRRTAKAGTPQGPPVAAPD